MNSQTTLLTTKLKSELRNRVRELACDKKISDEQFTSELNKILTEIQERLNAIVAIGEMLN